MIERILDLLAGGWDLIAPLFVVKVYEGGVVLRFGKYQRTVEPGLHFKWPLVDLHQTTKTCVTTMRLPPQTLTTADDHSVVVSAVVKYQVRDVRPLLTEIWDAADVLADTCMGAIRRTVNDKSYADLVKADAEDAVLERIRAEVNRYGFKVHRLTFTDLGRVRSIRLVQPTPINIDN